MGALLSGPLSDLAGRKVTVVVGASLCAVGGALHASSFYLWSDWLKNVVEVICNHVHMKSYIIVRMLFLGRVISGMGIGYGTVPFRKQFALTYTYY